MSTLYTMFSSLAPGLRAMEAGTTLRSTSPPYMDLVGEVLERSADGRVQRVSLAHYYEQNGDLMADPEMEFRVVHPSTSGPGMLVPLHYKQDGLGIFRPTHGPGVVYPKQLKEQVKFTRFWLRNLKSQGHRLNRGTVPNS
ncbi:MAG: hypothetical protein AABX89_07450 [Candidatus Thermoplasmatota archaeon]